MTEETTVTAVAEQIIITEPEPQPDFAERQAVITELAKRYPQTFFIDTKQRKPLAIRIFAKITKACPDIPKTNLRKAIGFYCSHFDYLASLQNETHRINLQGELVAEISPQHKEDAKKRIDLATKTNIKTPKNTQFSESDMAERQILTLKRKSEPATTEIKTSPVKPVFAGGDTAHATAKNAKITLVLATDSITRINSEGKKQIKLVVQVGEMQFTAELNSKSYRKALATIDELGADNCNAILQGSMPKFGILDGVGLVVQAKKAQTGFCASG